MKSLLATMTLAAGLAAVLASPALAQNGTYRQSRDPYAARDPSAAYAAQRGNASNYRPAQRTAPRQSYDVYDTRGHYVGSDPDPTIRDQLAHDPSQGA